MTAPDETTQIQPSKVKSVRLSTEGSVMLVTPANPGNRLQDCCGPEIHSSALVRKGFKPAVLKNKNGHSLSC